MTLWNHHRQGLPGETRPSILGLWQEPPKNRRLGKPNGLRLARPGTAPALQETYDHPALIAAHGLKPDEYEAHPQADRRTPSFTELGIFSAVERALLVQVLPHPPAHASHQGALGDPGPGQRTRRDRHRRRACGRVQDGEPQSPSYIEPYQGATTGVGGILRDVFTMGRGRSRASISCASVIPRIPRRATSSPVVAGIGGYGNSFGVPIVGSSVGFHTRYDGNCLVNAMAGLAETDKIFYAAASGVGMPIVYLGSKTGRDGIHGASMASAEFDEDSRPSARPYRLATHSRKSSCSKPAWKSWPRIA
jgi:phosphoribosylformylglycinamidine synthase